CNVPNVLSFDLSSAANAITATGLAVGTVGSTDNCVDPGTVQVQNPSGGTAVAPGSAVNLTISTCNGGGDPK
ncbi:MAG TPA: PASTA domain-containing protein, partial [Kribbellaceae bacterium]|nr:PASTA domain-containing protein [Kribbellaceae bacterium]